MASTAVKDLQVTEADFRACWQTSLNERTTVLQDRWKRAYKILMGKIDSTHPIPLRDSHNYSLANREAIAAQIQAALLGPQDIIAFQPSGSLSLEEAAELTSLVNQDFKMTRFRRELRKVSYDLTDHGTCFFKTIQEKRERLRQVRPDFEGESSKESTVLYYEGPYTFRVPLEDLFLDPSCGWDLWDADWIFHRTMTTLFDLEVMLKEDQDLTSKDKENIQKVLSGAGSVTYGGASSESPMDTERTWGRRYNGRTGNFRVVEKKEGWFRVGRDKWEVFTWAADLPIKHTDNPYWISRPPFHSARQVAFPDEAYGLGIIFPAEGIQHTIDDTSNLLVLRGLQEVLPSTLKRAGAAVDVVQLRPGFGTTVTVDDFDDVRPFHERLQGQGTRYNREMLVSALENVQGAGKGDRGQATGEPTWRQTLFLKEMSATRRGLVVTDIGDTIVGIGQMHLDFHYQFTDKRSVRIKQEGKETWKIFVGNKIKPDEVYDAEAGCVTATTNDMQKALNADLYDKVSGDMNEAQKGLMQETLLDQFRFPNAEAIVAAGRIPEGEAIAAGGPLPEVMPPALPPPVAIPPGAIQGQEGQPLGPA